MQVLDQKNSAGSSGMLCVFQKECVISKSKKIVTSSFGPCHILTGHDPETKYSFMAHVDYKTDVQGIHDVFCTLRKLGVDVNNLTCVRLMGGWASDIKSNQWAEKIVDVLTKEGIIGKVDFTYFQKKVVLKEDESDDFLTHFPGAHLDSQTGLISFFNKPWNKLEQAQLVKSFEHGMEAIKEAKSNLGARSSEELMNAAQAKLFSLKITVS